MKLFVLSTPHILLTRHEDFPVRQSYLFQWTLAHPSLTLSAILHTTPDWGERSIHCWTGWKTGLGESSGSRMKSDEKPHVCDGKSPCRRTSWTKTHDLKTDFAEKVPMVLTQNFYINKWVHQQCTLLNQRLDCISRSVASRLWQMAPCHPVCESTPGGLWPLLAKTDKDTLRWIQCRATKLVRGPVHRTHEERWENYICS